MDFDRRALNPGEPDRALLYVYDRGTNYERDTRVTEALEVLIPEHELVDPDQRLFQTVHLVTEYFWYGIHFELRRVVDALDGDDYALADDLLDRAAMMADGPLLGLRLLLRCLPQYSLLRMREHFPPDTSGFDSPGGANMRRIAGPVWRSFEAALDRHGMSLERLSLTRMEASGGGARLNHAVALLAKVHDGLHRLDVQITTWRQLHLKLARTQLGSAAAADGTTSRPEPVSLRGRPVSDLERIADKPFFPALWEVPGLIFDVMAGGGAAEPGRDRPANP
ncbi:MAG TPA: hypothetical protein VF712_01760 [Thermoleophilaceae bacterium]|jgi:hypothetical protein